MTSQILKLNQTWKLQLNLTNQKLNSLLRRLLLDHQQDRAAMLITINIIQQHLMECQRRRLLLREQADKTQLIRLEVHHLLEALMETIGIMKRSNQIHIVGKEVELVVRVDLLVRCFVVVAKIKWPPAKDKISKRKKESDIVQHQF